MKNIRFLLLSLFSLALLACGQGGQNAGEQTSNDMPAPVEAEPAETEAAADPEMAEEVEMTEIVPGLTMRVLREGSGDVAAAGQTATVHYTGWLYDPGATDNRGAKFDSSVDRGTPFEFPLGAGRVIQGWDRGVEGMTIGEARELTIAPELAYGDRAIGELIPPGSTLLFEVELLELSGGSAAE